MKQILSFLKKVFIGTCMLFGVACNSKVSFKINFIVDDVLYASVDTSGNEVIAMPKDPLKENYTFDGWYWDKDVWKNEFSARSLLDTPLSSNMEVYAHFVDETYLFGTDIRVKTATKVAVEGVGDVFYLTQRNSQVVLKLEDFVECNPKTTWVLTKDLSGNNIIPSKTIELNIGDSPLYYISVTDKNQNHETYILLVHRNYMYTVTFNVSGGTYCASQNVEEGYYLQNIPESTKYGYEFAGWDYDFSQPIKANVTANAKWNPVQSVLTFNVNGGNQLSVDTMIAIFNGSVTLPTPTRTGYKFLGWCNENGVYVSSTLHWPYIEDMVLTARWEAIVYKITYNLNGGNTGGTNFKSSYTIEEEFYLQMPYKTGNEFIGWTTTPSGNGVVNYLISKGTTGDLTFYAQWKPNTYNITFDVNGGDPFDDNVQSITYGSSVALPTPSRFGYEFLGWDSPFGTYSGSNTIIWNHDCDATLTALWRLIAYKIYYHLNGGSTAAQYPATYNVNDLGHTEIDDAILSNLPSRKGYQFDGLFDDENFDKPYTPIADQTWLGDKHVYFRWAPNKYVISFDVNGGNPLPNETMDVFYECDYVLPIPTRDGYSFQGWYNGSEKVTDGTWTRLDNLDLVAKWSINNYRITYNMDGGVNHINNPSVYTYEDDDISIIDPTKTGYTFLGWTNESITSPTKDYVISHNSCGNLTLNANWQVNKYTITFNANGGTGLDQEVIVVEYDSDVELPELSRTGYTFAGWYNGTVKYESGKWKTADDITLTAQWTIISYAITYELDGGSNDVSNPSSYTYEDADITLLDPTKTGYTFLGWTAENVSKPTKGLTIPNHSIGDKAFTAHWKVNEYVIHYDVNGGTDLDSPTQKVVYGDEFTLATPTRPGYEFAGWFADGQKVESGTWKYLEDIYLTAQWTIITYKITYALNGGANSSQNPSTYTYEDEVVFANPSRNGYDFVGWFTNGNQITSIPNHSTGDVTLEAKWDAILHSLIVDGNDDSKGAVTIVKGAGYTDEEITVSATPLDGYMFKGWFVNSELVSDKAMYTFVMPANDYHLTANFMSESEYRVSNGIDPVINLNNQTITYGLYPQTVLTDNHIISMLNEIENPEENGWYLLNGDYYAKIIGNPSTSNDSVKTFDNGSNIVKGKTYWFKCTPIVWNILSSSGNEYLLLSKHLLDESIFGQDANYMNSAAREKINNSFYNSALSLNNNYVKTTLVDNSVYSTMDSSNDYVCANTNDKVFLLSYRDYKNTDYGFAADGSSNYNTSRYSKTTDYVRANGGYAFTSQYSSNKNGNYWTRSPENSKLYGRTFEAKYITCEGVAVSGQPARSIESGIVTNKMCIRPAITFAIS